MLPPLLAHVVLDFLRNLFGSDEAEGYERQVLERKHRELTNELAAKRRRLKKVPTTKSKKKMHPVAKAALDEIDRLEKRRKEIEKKLGGVPESTSKSRRRSRRG